MVKGGPLNKYYLINMFFFPDVIMIPPWITTTTDTAQHKGSP